MGETLLVIKNLECPRTKGDPVFSHVNFEVKAGDIVVIQGKSGVGKSTLLKCLSHLNIYKGEILYRGKTPKSYGIPVYRTRVLYVPQRASLLPGTPRDFMAAISKFGSHSKASRMDKADNNTANGLSHETIELAQSWGIDEELWDRNWSNLSGGEMQRIALAIAMGMSTAEVLLLDEPTSALDPDTSATVENFLKSQIQAADSKLKALVWVTHSEEQGRRVGNRFIRLSAGGIQEEDAGAAV
ncbi:P-loop containing nucleoside triphosphate hydrolase protein [Laetiporus sulphureus 93-53]|uniref:p-loop containing nucleoside triphosphate hydrolase protein n=1 Tax=Laetiporus sulphureus 93-53 TaxID=1314785 RepID=A0A165H6M2_9APHY|nr:P-loop containing nucleoside triphosphate hydrolase protein [Laetiporus sulphureus 93-53]KZT11314.1 P-loop containing nucleoside triphosphate hydrolase protein [Laetiporus sulphureus 93-53]